jgi:cysteine desulfurase/selenocysteine lyase
MPAMAAARGYNARMGTVWDEVRRDFPALSRHVYLNAAAASPTPRPVREAVDRFFRELEEGGDVRWEGWLEEQERIRGRVAAFVGAQPEEIAFVPNTTTGINLIADLLADDGAVLADEREFPTVTLPWIHRGVTVHFLPAGPDGVLPAAAYDEARAPSASTIAVSHVQYTNGCRQDLEALGALKGRRHLVVSASQSVGAFAVDVERWGVDALASAGHKWLCAGYGAGFVFIRRALLRVRPPRTMGWFSVENPFAFDNRAYRLLDANRRVEAGCPAFAGAFALGAAVGYLESIGKKAIEARVLELNRILTDGLLQDGMRVLSPCGPHRSGQTLVAVPEPARAAAFLASRGVLVTEKPQGIRVSTHFYNLEEDIQRCRAALREYAGGTLLAT